MMSMLADDLGAFLKAVWHRLPLKLQADLVSSYTEGMGDPDDTNLALYMAIDNMNDSDEYAAEFAMEVLKGFAGYAFPGMNFPLIVVERPHQGIANAWIAYDEGEITEQLHSGNYGDNWSRDEYQCLDDWICDFGECKGAWPEDAEEQIKKIGFPMVACQDGSGQTHFYRKEDAPSELDFAIEYMGHDMFALDLLESRNDAERLMKCKSHNIPKLHLELLLDELRW